MSLAAPEPVFFDFTELGALKAAERTFYQVAIGAEAARKVLDEQLENLRELARWTAAHVAAAVLDDPRALTNAAFVRGIDVDDLRFDPEAMAASLAAACRDSSEIYAWSFETPCMARFRTARLTAPAEAEMAEAGARG